MLNASSQIVDVAVFLDMATSRRQLVRVSDATAGLLGLHDPLTGQTMYVPESKLCCIAAVDIPAQPQIA